MAVIDEIVYKQSDTSRNSSDAVADDPELVFSALPPGQYAIQGFLSVSCAANNINLRAGLGSSVADSGIQSWIWCRDDNSRSTDSNFLNNKITSPVNTRVFSVAAGDTTGLIIHGVLNLTQSTNVSIQWAQATANATNMTLQRGSWLRIRKFDAPDVPGLIELSSATYSAMEGDEVITITLNRQNGVDGAVSVRVTTSDGTATAGVDYTAVDTVVNWADGDGVAKTVDIPIASDSDVEGNETINVALSDVTGGADLGLSSAVATITNDDIETTTLMVMKYEDTIRTGSGDGTTATPDPDLVIADIQPGRYHIEACFHFNAQDIGDSSPGFRAGFNCSAAPDGTNSQSGYAYDTRQSTSFTSGRLIFANGNNNANISFNDPDTVVFSISALLTVADDTPLTLSAIWSPQSANATPLILKAGSWLTITGPLS